MKYKITLAFATIVLMSGCQAIEFNFINKEDTIENQSLSSENENNNGSQNSSEEGQAENLLTLPAQYFNQIEEVDGEKVIQNYENTLVLVNKIYSLPDSYIPSDLVRPNVNFSFGDAEVEKALLRQEAAVALEKLFLAAENDGIELFAISGYRSYNRQIEVFNAEVSMKGLEKAAEAVANPGQSEHQTGLAMDISSRSVNLDLTQDFENTIEGQWLAANAHEYGFILRYPKGKEDITGFKYEPWHFRYVGKDFARTIYEKDLTLEEYFNIVKEI